MTRRTRAAVKGRSGINYVRTLVDSKACLFHEIHDDIGNDAFIELTEKGRGTGCCVAAQVKSGESFRAKDHYFIDADADHVTYWKSHLMPVAGIVFDPDEHLAFWVDITAWTKSGPPSGRINVPRDQPLTEGTFEDFRRHFLQYQQEFSSDAHFGRALDSFATASSRDGAFEALRALFAFHRNRPATWVYICQSLRRLARFGLVAAAANVLRHVPGHGDVFWSDKNEMDEAARDSAREALRQNIGTSEILLMLDAVDEDHWFYRGSVGQDVHSIVSLVVHDAALLAPLALGEGDASEHARFMALLLAVHELQHRPHGLDLAAGLIGDFLRAYPGSVHAVSAKELRRQLREHGSVSFY